MPQIFLSCPAVSNKQQLIREPSDICTVLFKLLNPTVDIVLFTFGFPSKKLYKHLISLTYVLIKQVFPTLVKPKVITKKNS